MPQRKGSPPRPDLIEPVWEYNRNLGKLITGGNAYRCKQVPDLIGAYLYGDYVTGQIWALFYDRNKKSQRKSLDSAERNTANVIRRR
jgi:hypothetical protein